MDDSAETKRCPSNRYYAGALIHDRSGTLATSGDSLFTSLFIGTDGGRRCLETVKKVYALTDERERFIEVIKKRQ